MRPGARNATPRKFKALAGRAQSLWKARAGYGREVRRRRAASFADAVRRRCGRSGRVTSRARPRSVPGSSGACGARKAGFAGCGLLALGSGLPSLSVGGPASRRCGRLGVPRRVRFAVGLVGIGNGAPFGRRLRCALRPQASPARRVGPLPAPATGAGSGRVFTSTVRAGTIGARSALVVGRRRSGAPCRARRALRACSPVRRPRSSRRPRPARATGTRRARR